jgi:hypothetical protein
MTDAPLIYTSKGNVPVDSLSYEKDWQIDDDLIVFTEVWRDETGAIVKNNVHMYAKKGLPQLGAVQAVMQ